MTLSFTPEQEAFRNEVRTFLAEQLPAATAAKVREGQRLTREDMADWHARLNARGWLAGHWPVAWGGPGWTPVQTFIFENECALAYAPRIVPFGVNMLGPVLIKFGTEAQKRRWLPRILDGSDWWCQGYSEPGAGSDLAGLKTSAVRHGADRGAWQSLVELGAVAVLFPEAVGGMGGSGFDIAVVFESLGRGLVVEPVAGTLMAGQVLAATGGDVALATLRELIDGEDVVVMAHEETATGADVTGVGLPATRETAGWRLRGQKVVVHQAEMADAFVVSARSAGVPGDVDGLSLFLVPAGAPGLHLRGYPLIDGGRAAELTFDVGLPDSALLGTAGRAHTVLERAVGTGLVALAAEALGAMEVAKAATLEYLRTRKQFGVPIGSFQALQHRMADLLLEVEQARSAVINAAAALESDNRISRERALSAAKVTVGRVGTLVAEESIQLHGAIGMSWELPLAHYAKRLVMIDHQLGDEDQHLARFIALGRA